jgi:hypothetical protein
VYFIWENGKIIEDYSFFVEGMGEDYSAYKGQYGDSVTLCWEDMKLFILKV